MASPARGASFVTIAAVLAAAVLLVKRLAFLRPYFYPLVREHGAALAAYAALAAFNVFALAHYAIRKLGRKDPGSKMRHLDRELYAATEDRLSSEVRAALGQRD